MLVIMHIRPAGLIVALAACASSFACGEPTAPRPELTSTAPTTDVFLVAGQSNGRGPYGLSRYTDLLATLDKPTAWPTFAVEYHIRTGREVAIVNATRAGTSLTFRSDQSRSPGYLRGSWDRRGPHFGASVAMLDSALEANPLYALRGLIWVQGEADASAIERGVITGGLYERTLVDLVSRYRERYGSDLPVYIVRTGKLMECSPDYPCGQLHGRRYEGIQDGAGRSGPRGGCAPGHQHLAGHGELSAKRADVEPAALQSCGV
jgi:hypothetical protein